MDWNDLTLSDKAKMMQLAVKSGITDLRTIQEVYNKFAEGGLAHKYDGSSEDTNKLTTGYPRRKYNGKEVNIDEYKEAQRQVIREAAVKKALTRETGTAPIINGSPAASCIYTVTDNFGNKYRVAGNQTFFRNPEKYGFKVNGPIENAEVGDLYQMFDTAGTPDHMVFITGIDEKGNPLISYSSGNAGQGRFLTPLLKEVYEAQQELLGESPETKKVSYEEYLKNFEQDKANFDKRDYHRDVSIFTSPMYETYRFIGTPEDNVNWEKQFLTLPSLKPKQLQKIESLPVNIEVPKTNIESIHRYNYGGEKEQYNIYTDKNSYAARDAHRKSLDAFIKDNPELYGLKTADFADFFSQLAGLESSYKSTAGKGMIYSGYYGLKGGRDLDEDAQHKEAFKHLKSLFKESMVKEDLAKGIELGYTPAQILAKYWNQGNRATNYLWNDIDDEDGVGTKISTYGNNMTADVDYKDYLSDAITDDFSIVKNVTTLPNTIKRARNKHINYSNRKKSILDFNDFDPGKLHVGDTIWVVPSAERKKKQ